MADGNDEGGGAIPEEDDYPDSEDDYEQGLEALQDNDIVKRLNEALGKQLQVEFERLREELREKEEHLRRARQKRQDVGVELYGVQQQLARMQMQLEKTHDNFNIINRIRMQSEQDLKGTQSAHVEQKGEIGEKKVKADQYQADLDKLNLTVRQVEMYNEQQKHEIAVTRRITYKAEEAVSNLEKDKKQQDFLIDSLNEQMKTLHENLALYEAQLISQRQETKSAYDTLAEAAAEMEAINFEKKQLLQQWKSSLIGMQRRDEALQAAEAALRQQQEQMLSLESEINGFKARIKAEQDRNERLIGTLQKMQSEANFLQRQIETVKEKREKLNERYSMLKKSLDQTDAETIKADAERASLVKEMMVVDKKLMEVAAEVLRLDDEILNKLSEQKTIDKGTQNVLQAIQKMRKQIHDKDMQSAQLSNEVARIRVDMLNTESHNVRLRENLKELDQELKQRSSLVEKYEMEIRRRNDEIEKKQSEVDRLNRRLDQLLSNMEDENLGPLEATIHNLSKAIAGKQKECVELQRAWINDQNELVGLVNESNQQSEQIQNLKSEYAVLNQRRIRIEGQLDSHERESKELENGIRQMHKDMGRLNDLVAKNSQLQELLLDANFNLENDFVRRLKELEVEAVKIEAGINGIQDEKARILNETVEAERQIMVWERKLQIEKETMEALDPNVGSEMTQSMRREIHRMKLRLAELLKKQEQLVKDIERSIYKRDNISVKGRAATKSTGITQGTLKKTIDTLTKRIKETDADAQGTERAIRRLDVDRNSKAQQLEDIARNCDAMKLREEELVKTIDQYMNDKLKYLGDITRFQRMARQLGVAKDNKYNMTVGPDRVADEVETALERTSKIKAIINVLKAKHPVVETHLDNMLATIWT